MCDNLKTGVISHPRDGEVVLNDAYRSMAEHYSAAVIPGRVRRPKDKPSAENTVWHATMALAGAMRDRAFASLDELWTGNGVLDGFLEDESLFGEFLRTPVSEGGVESLVVEPPHIVVEVGA